MLQTCMKLQQGQIWKQGDDYYVIVEWARQTIQFKKFQNMITREGTSHFVTKKEFCKLIKDAELLPEMSRINREH